jgi:hypothetical protein
MAVVYCAFVLGMFAVRGTEPFRRVRGGLIATMLLYVFSALTAGVIVGILGRFVTRWYAAMIVGAIAALPVGLAATALTLPPERWARDFILVALLFAFFVGPLCGLSYWYVVRRATGAYRRGR